MEQNRMIWEVKRNMAARNFIMNDDCQVYQPSSSASRECSNREAEMNATMRERWKSIGRFFFEAGVDIECVESSSFLNMTNVAREQGRTSNMIPRSQDLKGWILDELLQEMKQYVKEIRELWATTGCSILLDEWTDTNGRHLVNFLVDCPQGTVYLRSSDISGYDDNIDALHSLFDEMIREVGDDNVVQIISSSTTRWTPAFLKEFKERHEHVYWTVSASHCIELMLDKLRMTVPIIKKALSEAKTVTRLFHGNAAILELFREETGRHCLLKPSKFKSAMPFLTLENIVIEKKNLRKLIFSQRWSYSRWTSTEEAKRVARWISGESFWTRIKTAVKATMPLVNALRMIAKAEKPLMGYICDTLNQVKEAIQHVGFGNMLEYMPIWHVIEDIWNAHLYCHLHAAGYYLNPSLYSNHLKAMDVHDSCISRMGKDLNVQQLVNELKNFDKAKEEFNKWYSVNKRIDTSPDKWWQVYGIHWPHLQKYAVKLLSQTCDGAAKYGLNRSLAEKFLANDICSNEKFSKDFAFVHYNLQLRNFQSPSDITVEEVNLNSDWIGYGSADVTSQTNDEFMPTIADWSDEEASEGEGS